MPEKELPSSGTYYYAGGERIELTPADDLVAIETSGDEDDSALAGRALTAGLRLVEAKDVAAASVASSPKYPVYRMPGAIVVALPEVRVEESREGRLSKLDEWLKSHDEAVVVSRDEDRVVIKPASGLGGDALAIANDLAESVGPELAQARFIRVVPRPDDRRNA